jgi:hypothetical protein
MDGLAVEQRTDGVDAGPLARVSDQALLGTVAENVLNSTLLDQEIPAGVSLPVTLQERQRFCWRSLGWALRAIGDPSRSFSGFDDHSFLRLSLLRPFG